LYVEEKTSPMSLRGFIEFEETDMETVEKSELLAVETKSSIVMHCWPPPARVTLNFTKRLSELLCKPMEPLEKVAEGSRVGLCVIAGLLVRF